MACAASPAIAEERRSVFRTGADGCLLIEGKEESSNEQGALDCIQKHLLLLLPGASRSSCCFEWERQPLNAALVSAAEDERKLRNERNLFSQTFFKNHQKFLIWKSIEIHRNVRHLERLQNFCVSFFKSIDESAAVTSRGEIW